MTRRKRMLTAGGITTILLAGTAASGGAAAGTSVTISDKGFTESAIVAQAYAQALKAKGFNVTVKSLASTALADAAITKGDIDVYPEYTGTVYYNLMKRSKTITNGTALFSLVKAFEAGRGLVALNQSPYNNDNEVACTPATVKKYKLTTLSSLKKAAGNIVYSANPEHLTRRDGLPLLVNTYGIEFKSVQAVDISLRYKPIEQKKAQCVYAFGTDPQIAKLKLVVLRDDKKRFQGTPFQSFPVVSKAYLDSAPASFSETVNRVSAALDAKAITALNAKVTFGREDPDVVAAAFLKSKGLA